jgi:gliding-associated putative ABC transporter substrate-binding component GldG
MDTLMTKKKLMAYPIDINMTDFFFNYGVRINAPLIKDFQKSALIRLQVGEVAGNPQYTNLIWPYFPLGINENNNPITKNINPVKFEFPTAIDTLGRKNIKTQVLYESSERTTAKSVPNYVELSEMANLDSLSVMEKPTTPKIFAVSLEGKFTSAYANRSEKNGFPNFKNEVAGNNKMIVISDGDVGRNQMMKGQNLPLGADLLTDQLYGNEQFLRNCLDWLLDDSNLIELRNRNIESRLLDRRRIDEEKTNWQWFNLLTPLAILGLLGGIFFWLRKKKFGQ